MAHKPSVNAEFVDKVLRESTLGSTAVNRLHQDYKKSVKEAIAGAAGWHGSDDIQTLTGLEGSFLWSEDPVAATQINFKFDAGHVGNQGTYKLSAPGKPVEQGSFFSVPNNPAIGWAFVNLLPAGLPPRSFIVSGMMTDEHWQIIIGLLKKTGADGPLQPAFSIIRTGA
ncbi:hypothetical protein [Aquabacterium sp.]|uniref:hypothetical protein n=1 Tax=Aquabacterium sp. TaxID=1872578 RepID=UPI002C0A7E00|nr:hypothetical protein [Aquabacterium sp.]HSW05420.1 hypothetical protein [Aquabacterium sp.]